MKRRILVIDDDPHMHRIVQLYLRDEPLEIDFVHSAKMALAKIGKHKYDLIITDIQMPGMNGVELIKRIRETNDRIPILILSAFEHEQFNQELDPSFELHVIPKPFDQNTLVSGIYRVFNGAKGPTNE